MRTDRQAARQGLIGLLIVLAGWVPLVLVTLIPPLGRLAGDNPSGLGLLGVVTTLAGGLLVVVNAFGGPPPTPPSSRPPHR